MYADLHSRDGDFGDQPRSKYQLSIIGARNGDGHSKTGEQILAYNEELHDKIIWHHSDLPDDLWVLGTSKMRTEIINSVNKRPLSVDPTFNFGAFEVTPITYRHHFIESRSKNIDGEWTDAVIIGPTIVHHGKSEEVYDIGISSVARKARLTSATFGYITDGESALISGCKKNFSNAQDMRCTKHFKSNCEDQLKDIGVAAPFQSAFLDILFGLDGLTEAEDEIDLDERLKEMRGLIKDMER